jgi:hypothetical protein
MLARLPEMLILVQQRVGIALALVLVLALAIESISSVLHLGKQGALGLAELVREVLDLVPRPSGGKVATVPHACEELRLLIVYDFSDDLQNVRKCITCFAYLKRSLDRL